MWNLGTLGYHLIQASRGLAHSAHLLASCWRKLAMPLTSLAKSALTKCLSSEAAVEYGLPDDMVVTLSNVGA